MDPLPAHALGALDPRDGSAPACIAVAQQRPGEIADPAIEELRQRSPLQRIWRVLGPWCEGETRSGKPPAGCIACAWHQWPARYEWQLEIARRGGVPIWALPVTATNEERLLAEDAAGWPTCVGHFLVCATSGQAAGALADVVRAAGGSVQIAREAALTKPTVDERRADVRTILWDVTPEALNDGARIARVRAFAPQARLIAITGYPRPDDVEAAQAHGVDAVVGKPFLVSELVVATGGQFSQPEASARELRPNWPTRPRSRFGL